MPCRKKPLCVFGPVDSRRLGRSLGINLVPFKTCSMNCIYCECGETTFLTAERKEFFPAEEVLGELAKVLEERRLSFGEDYGLDFVTFSGLGEPTLHSRFGEILRRIREKYPMLKTCLLTNASLFSDPVVRKEAAQAHLVIPSLDGSNEEEFRKINRPEKNVTFQKVLEGITSFRRETEGRVKMFLEVFLVPGINDSPSSAERFRLLAEKIRPDAVQLNFLDRPGAVSGLAPVPEETLERFSSVISPSCPVEIPGRKKRDPGTNFAEVEFSLLNLLRKNGPCDAEKISADLLLPGPEIQRHLGMLCSAGFARTGRKEQALFYVLTEAGAKFLREKEGSC